MATPTGSGSRSSPFGHAHRAPALPRRGRPARGRTARARARGGGEVVGGSRARLPEVLEGQERAGR